MANNGLYKFKNNTIISNSYGTDDICFINFNKDDGGFNIEIPILDVNEGIENKIGPIVLTFSKSNINKIGSFGKGIRLKNFKKLGNTETFDNGVLEYLYVSNSDFTGSLYSYYNNYNNTDNNTFFYSEVVTNDNNEFSRYKEIRLYDNKGNYYVYNNTSSSLPDKIVRANGEEIIIHKNPNLSMVFGKYQILFEKNSENIVDKVKFIYDNNLITRVDLIYQDKLLKRIKKYMITRDKNGVQNETILTEKEYTFTDNFVKCRNSIDGKYMVYYFSDNKVNHYINCYETDETGIITKLFYYDNKTLIEDYKGNTSTIYYNGLDVINVVDPMGFITLYNYKDGNIINSIRWKNYSYDESCERGNLIANRNDFIIRKDEEIQISADNGGNGQLVNLLFRNIYNYNRRFSIIKSNVNILKNSVVNFLGHMKKRTEGETNEKIEIKLKLNKYVNGSLDKTQFITFNVMNSYEKLLIGNMIVADDNYNEIELEFIVPGVYCAYSIFDIQLYNKLYGVINEYNEIGQIIKQYTKDNFIKKGYIKEENKYLGTASITKGHANLVNYDEKNNPIEVINNNGIVITNQYDQNNNIIKQVKENAVFYQDENYTYTPDGLSIQSITSNENKVTTFCYDDESNNFQFNNNRFVKMVTHYNGLINEYQYDDLFRLDQVNYIYNNSNISNKYHYDAYDRIKSIDNGGINNINFEYDHYGNVYKVLINKNQNTEEIIEYLEYLETDNEIYTNNLGIRKLGNGTCNYNRQRYEYDNFDRLTKVYSLKTSSADELLLEFVYLDDKIIKIIDHKNNETIELVYDVFDNIIEEIRTIYNDVQTTTYKVNDTSDLLYEFFNDNGDVKDYYSFNGSDSLKNNSPVKVRNYYKSYNKELYSCFLMSKNKQGIINKALSNNFLSIDPKFGLDKEMVGLTNITKAIKLNSGNLSEELRYDIPSNGDSVEKTISFWIKGNILNNSNEKEILLVENANKFECDNNIDVNYCISLSLDSNNNVILNNFNTGLKFKNNQWNFIAVSYSFEEYSFEYNYRLNINGEIYNIDNYLGALGVSSHLRLKFKHNYSQEDILLTCLTAANYKLSNEEIMGIYYHTKNNYIEYDELDTDTTLITNRFDQLSDYIVIPLYNTFDSFNKDISYTYETRFGFDDSIDSSFAYNDVIKDYGYVSTANKLIYQNEFNGMLSLGFKTSLKELKEKNVLFELGKSNQDNSLEKEMTIYLNNQGNVIIDHQNTNTNTNLTITPNTETLFKFSIYLDNYYQGQYVYRIQLKVNDSSIYSKFIYSNSLLTMNKIILGRSFDDNEINQYQGIFNMLCIYNNNSSLEAFSSFDSKDKNIKIYDNMGFLKQEEVRRNGEQIFKRILSRKNQLVNGKTKCYNMISNEKYFNNTNNPIRSIYYFDNNNDGYINNIIRSGLNGDVEDTYYSYDELGRLINEQIALEDINRYFTYDSNGNILCIRDYTNNSSILSKDLQFNYVNNKLVAYSSNGVMRTVEYDDNLTGMPIKIIENGNVVNTFEWSFDKLTKYTIGENKKITFNYNSFGKRIRKVYDFNGDKIFKDYKYIGNRLIEEKLNDDIIGDVNTLYYLYDANNTLYGLKYNSTEYYYLRDCLNNIIGIIDGNKNIVCEYVYDAYGNHKVLDSNGVENTNYYFIGNLNPFRYRGYYYDVETGWFWLSSRYYSPELCRFISPDDIDYLDPESVNGLNLYCYCLNDPINNIDPTGHFVITTAVIWTAIGIGAAIGAGLGLVASAAKDLENGKLFDGDVSFLSYLGNFVGGGIAGVGIGLCSVLGAGLGAAIASKTSLIVGAKIVGGVAVGGTKISGLAALGIGAVGAFATGALGYTARTLISDRETFELSDMFIEAGANMLSGMTTFAGSVIGGLIGINVPGKFSFKNFALNQMLMGLSGFYLLKYALSLLKKKLQEIY